MTGWQMLLGQVLIFLLAVGGIILCSLLALRFAGTALNKARSRPSRVAYGLAALASVLGIIACAAAGFLGIGYLLYTAQA